MSLNLKATEMENSAHSIHSESGSLSLILDGSATEREGFGEPETSFQAEIGRFGLQGECKPK